ncbi:DUF1294 domain-containing protein [Enterococcus sp. 5H]|uniref:DUF1294 domain-containing protein n=1 Tax=Enterococcus sp. 5H TaxID=1229490 RepID=UPI002303BDC6|nr:DUF1294 domain-containing protein [Enterococcus sp. 5H]MDA9469960.1 phosphoesterase [Enterococcus sp. 5H]
MNDLMKHAPWIYLLLINVSEFLAMYFDKKRAVRKRWRIPEFDLLFMGIIGGGIGGLLAQQLFHHKTKKIRFYFFFIFGTLVAIAILYFSYKRTS